jgi:hypothetical protein
LFICKDSNGGSNKKNYNVEGKLATYSCNPRKKKQEKKGKEGKEGEKRRGGELGSTCGFNEQHRNTSTHSRVSHSHMHTSH